MTTTTSYISCACNRLPNTLDWGRNGLVCFATNHAVAIYDPTINEFGAVLRTLHGHSGRVNIVRWIKSDVSKLETELIAASADGTAIIWSLTDLNKRIFEKKSTLSIGEPLSICDAIYFNSNSRDLLICTGSINGNFRLWLRDDNDDVKEIQSIGFSRKLPVYARFTNLSNKKFLPILLLATEDATIDIYVPDFQETENCKLGKFVKMQSLIGHEDWVTCIDCVTSNEGDIFMASGSQDNMIRLWKISESENDEEKKDGILRPKKQKFSICNQEYELALESILISHEAWVYGVHWSPAVKVDDKYSQPMTLLSCSLDKSAIIWEPSDSAGIWSESVRVGEVGGNSLGFYGCKFGPTGKNIITHGFQGALYIWMHRDKENDWAPRTAVTGHYDQVVDLCWDPKGRFLVTVSSDQTTRVHAPWIARNNQESWHEIGRPQVHGYDMNCMAMLTPYMFASGADEKVVRIFTAPLPFKNYLKKITDDVEDFESTTMAEGASVPALGLTNKALIEGETEGKQEEELMGSYSRDLNYDEPPLEEELIRRTLWPELQKLYGHGYEIFAMAARHDGSLLATASKSASVEHAAIIVWDTQTWSQSQKLTSHQLTITQMAFSPNDKYLLAVSRDRRWSLFTLKNGKYELFAASMKKDTVHARIIWCCAWSDDSKYFITGSRDGKIGFWNENVGTDGQLLPVTSTNVDISVTALAFAPNKLNDFPYIIAIGYENGSIEIKKVSQTENSDSFEWKQLILLDSSSAHHATVKRLAFRSGCEKLQLASCGSDGVVKVHSINLS